MFRVAVCLTGLLAAGIGLAQPSYPNRPIRLIVPITAGGPNDVSARLLAQKLSEIWGQQVYVENMPGGSENIGTGAAARSQPNGYTALFVASAFTVNPGLYGKLPFDPIKDFTPITLMASGPLVLTVNPAVPARTVQELIALVRANPGKYSFASSGAATQVRMVGEQFRLKYGLDLVHVPFNGGGPAVTSTVAGHTPIAVTSLSAVAPLMREGKLRGLAVTSSKRSPAAPDVPTMAEAGVADLEAGSMQGVMMPAGVPRAIVDMWHREVVRIVALPDVKERLASLGLEPVANTPEEFSAFINAEIERWTKVIKDGNIRLE